MYTGYSLIYLCDAHKMFGHIVLCLIIHLFYFGHTFIPVNVLYIWEEQPNHLTWDKSQI